MSDTREEYRLYLPDFYPGEERLLEKLRVRIYSDPPYLRIVPIRVEDEERSRGRWLTDEDLGRPGTGYALHAINIPPCLAVNTSGEVAFLRLADEEKQIEGPSPEPEQEQPLQGPDGEAPAADPGIGAPGPLPDAGPQEEQVVEGVYSEAEIKAWRLAFDLGAMLSQARGILDDLQVAACKAIDDCVITKGLLVVQREGIKASLSWDIDGATLKVDASVSPDEED